MHVRADAFDEELQVTVDAAVEIANHLTGHDHEPRPQVEVEGADHGAIVRRVLVDHEFVRAAAASDDELDSLLDRLAPLVRIVEMLPEAPLVDAVRAVNVELAAAAIAPSLQAHDGFPLHIHWTGATTPFAHQVTVDLLMGIAQILCDHGTERFGRCAAVDCGRVFYDTSKNRSRRFCSDTRCANRTHTAAHRARRTGE